MHLGKICHILKLLEINIVLQQLQSFCYTHQVRICLGAFIKPICVCMYIYIYSQIFKSSKVEFQASLDRFIFISKVHQKLYVQEKAKLSCQTWRLSVGSPKSLLLVFATINTGVSVLYIHKNCEVITFVYIYIVDFFSPQKNNYFPPPCFSHRFEVLQIPAFCCLWDPVYTCFS